MKVLKVLNNYAGIGGNRKLWKDVEVTAVENNEEIAGIYKEYFPDDNLIIGDAHDYLLKHYKEFDFIWSSPPCQTHSRARLWGHKNSDLVEKKYPDMKLYQEILFLKHYYSGLWVTENVDPFYIPLIPATKKIGRHLFWANFKIRSIQIQEADIRNDTAQEFKNLHGFDLSNRQIEHRKDQILRNCVNPDLGLYILEQARGIIRESSSKQQILFQ